MYSLIIYPGALTPGFSMYYSLYPPLIRRRRTFLRCVLPAVFRNNLRLRRRLIFLRLAITNSFKKIGFFLHKSTRFVTKSCQWAIYISSSLYIAHLRSAYASRSSGVETEGFSSCFGWAKPISLISSKLLSSLANSMNANGSLANFIRTLDGS